MKTKKILSFIVALAMIVTVVPVFGITASAADFTLDQLIGFATGSGGYTFDGSYATVGAVTGTKSGVNIIIDKITSPEAWTGWTSSWSDGNEVQSGGTNINMISGTGGNYIQTYGVQVDSLDKVGTVTSSEAVQNGTKDKDFVILDFKAVGGDAEHDYGIYDTNSQLIDSFRNLNSTGEIGPTYADGAGTNYSFSGTLLFNTLTYTGVSSVGNDNTWLSLTGPYYRLVYENIDGGGYTAKHYYSTDGSTYTLGYTKTFSTGSVNGFGGWKSYASNSVDKWYNNTQVVDLKIYAGDYPEASSIHKVTVTYGTTDTTVELTGVEGATVTAPAKTITDGDTTYLFNAMDYTVEDKDTEVTLNPATTITAENGLIAHYTLGSGDGTANSEVTDSSGNNLTGSVIGSEGVKYNDNGYVTLPGGNGAGAIEIPNDIMRALEGDFTVSMWVRQDSTYSSDSKSIAFWDMANGNDTYDRLFVQQASKTTTIQNRYGDYRTVDTATVDATKDKWALVTASFDLENSTLDFYVNGEKQTLTRDTSNSKGDWDTDRAPANVYSRAGAAAAFYLGHNVWNNGDNPEMKGDMAQVRIYNKALSADEVSALLNDKKTVTVEYMADTTKIKDSTTVEYFSDEATVELPVKIEYGTTIYKLSGVEYEDDATTAKVTTEETTYTAKYVADTNVTVTAPDVPDVTVIQGNAPVLPAKLDVTVTAQGSSEGNTETVGVTWGDTSALSVGDNTVIGTIDGYGTEVSVKVNVLECTDDTNSGEIQSVVGQSESAVHKFNTAVKGNAYFEFDVKYAATPTSNYIVTLGDASTAVPVFSSAGNAIGLQENGFRNGTGFVKVGETFRVFINTNTSSYTYDVVVRDSSGSIVADDKNLAYRDNTVEELNAITVLTNWGSGAAGDIVVNNFRVAWSDIADYNTAYTVEITGAGDNDTSYKKYVSEDSTKGYNDEVIFPNVEIPYFPGYVFHTKTVSETDGAYTVTLAYEAVQDDKFFDNVDTTSTPVISLNMLGAHDAFTSGLTGLKGDAAQANLDDGGAALTAFISKNTSITKAQEKDVLELLHEGVRYFDVRVSRSTTIYDGTLIDIPHTNGVFYTSHNSLSDEFRPIAYTLGQWAKQHPGEVIILDFQNLADNGSAATTTSWTDLYAILQEAGLGDYAVINNGNAGSGNLAGATINQLTENGTHAGVLLFSQATGQSVGNFIGRQNGDLFSGRLYSNYETDLSSNISTSFSADYITAQVDYASTFSSSDDHIISWMVRVMQAQSESKTNLLTQAATDNTALYNAVTSGNYPTWLTTLPIVMVNGVGSNTADIVALLKQNNEARDVTVEYVNNDTTVASKTVSLMTGTLYEGETITQDSYEAPLRNIIKGTNGGMYAIQKATVRIPDKGDIVPVPSSGSIKIPVDKIEGAFTINSSGLLYRSKDDVDAFYAYNWGDINSPDRIGFATVSVPTEDADSYKLTTTAESGYLRNEIGGNKVGNVKIYALSESEFDSLDISSGETILAALSDKTPALEYTLDNSTNGSGVSYDLSKFLLDKTVVNAAKGNDNNVVLVGLTGGSMVGLTKGTIQLEPVVTLPTISASLGLDTTTGFKIVFLFDGVGSLETIATISSNATKSEFEGNDVEVKDKETVGVSTENTNLIYTATATAGGASTSAQASIYSLVIDEIIAGKYDKDSTDNKITDTNLDKINKVLAQGGLYLTNDGDSYKLPEANAKIMEVKTSGNEITVTLTDDAQKAGLQFADTSKPAALVDDKDANVVVSGDGTYVTVTLSDDTNVQEGETISLYAVQLEFVPPETVEEAEADDEFEVIFDDFEDIM